MDNTTLTIIGTGISIVGLLYAIIRNFRMDMDSRFDKIDKKFNEIDVKFNEMDKRVYITNQRMDGIYNILLKKLGE